jgi:hypothetical protein
MAHIENLIVIHFIGNILKPSAHMLSVRYVTTIMPAQFYRFGARERRLRLSSVVSKDPRKAVFGLTSGDSLWGKTKITSADADGKRIL